MEEKVMERVDFERLREILPTTVRGISEGQYQQTVDGRRLWEILQIDTRFNDWIVRRLDGWEESVDFVTILNSEYSPPAKDYHLTIRMAKHIAMMEKNNSRAVDVRDYFLWCEREVTSPGGAVELILSEMARAHANMAVIAGRLEDGQAKHAVAICNLGDEVKDLKQEVREGFGDIRKEIEDVKRHHKARRPSKTTMKILKMFTFIDRGGRCPIYRDMIIVDRRGKLIDAEPDHWDRRYDPTLPNMWLTSRKFNQQYKTFTQKSEKFGHVFRTYHEEMKMFCERFGIDQTKLHTIQKAWNRIFDPPPIDDGELPLFSKITEN